MRSYLWTRWRALFQRKTVESELDSELRFHFERKTEKLIQSGLTPEQARRQARIEIGGIEQVKEECRDVRGVRLLETLGQDIRLGLRRLVKSPNFAAAAVLTLALGIGANSAIFSAIDAVLLHPLPYPQASRIVGFTRVTSHEAPVPGIFNRDGFENLRRQSRAFEQVAAYHESQATLTGQGRAESLRALVTSPDMLPLLGTRLIKGRPFLPSDDRVGAPPVALLGETLWRAKFQADPGVIGRTIVLNGSVYTVVGVLPATLRFPPLSSPPDVWVPLAADPNPQLRQSKISFLQVIGRLKPGVTLEQANAELTTISTRVASQHPAEEDRRTGVVPLGQQMVKNYRPALIVLLAAVSLVLLIACANVANLLVARASVRERELAVRMALGASRRRVARQLLVESIELGLVGGAAGVLLAELAVRALIVHLPSALQEFQGVRVNGAVLATAAAVSIGVGLLAGLFPVWRLSDLRVHDALKAAGRSASGDQSGSRMREMLVVSEVALAVILLVGSGLLLHSFARLISSPLGFDPQGVLTASVNLPRADYQHPEQWRSFVSNALDRIRVQPGVRETAAAVTPPFAGIAISSRFQIVGHPTTLENTVGADFRIVTPGYFELMRIPLLRGRMFRAGDTASSEPVCVVNQAMASRFFSDLKPLGQQISGGMGQRAPCRIVGVVGNEQAGSLTRAPSPAVYAADAQDPLFSITFLVRGSGNAEALSGMLRDQIDAIDPNLAVSPVPMASQFSESLAEERIRTELVGIFAGLAIVLATVGITGVLAFSVSQRTREIGIRMALGAEPGAVLRQVVGKGLWLVGTGTVLGLVASLGLTRLTRNLLYGVEPSDPATYAAVVLLLTIVALGACALPARRAAQVDPAVTLRYE